MLMKSKLLKFLSIVAVVSCSFLFANANTAEAFGECYAATCGTTGAAKCIAKYPSYAAFAAANPNCASAFALRCNKNCTFDAANCPSAAPQCASADEPTTADVPASCDDCKNSPATYCTTQDNKNTCKTLCKKVKGGMGAACANQAVS